MNKLFSKIAALSVGLAMAVGVGVALGHEGVREVKADGEVSVTRSASTALSETAEAIDGDSNVTIKTSAANTYTNPNRFYANTTITIATANNAKLVSVKYSASSTGNYVTNAQNATVSPSVTPTVSNKDVTWDLSGENADSFTITVSAQTRWTGITVTYLPGSGPSVSISNLPSSFTVGDSGTLTASSSGATNPSYTWSSDSSIFFINENSGAYEANGYGVAKVTVNMSCDEGNASKTETIVIDAAETISVVDALALDPGTGETTAFSVLVEGYVTSLDPDTKTRALNISDTKVGTATSTDTIMVYGIYSDNAMRNYVILNGLIKFRAKVQNYKGTVQLSSYTLVSYSDAAMTYAKTAYESLNEACTTGPAAVTDEQWNGLATDFGALDEYARAKLAAAGSDYAYSEDIANWIGRYGRIVAAGRSNFMENVNVSSQYLGTFENSSNNSYIIIIVISAVSVMSFGLALFLRKKRSK